MEVATVLVPAHNEASTIGDLLFSFDALLRKNNYSPKFVIVNDGSRDSTLAEALALREKFGYQIKVIDLEQNVGQHPALLIGTNYIENSDYVVITDADSQNPPELTIKMLEKLKSGNFNIVYGLRRESRLGNGLLSKFFWLAVCAFSRFRVPRDQTPLKVFDRKFLEEFKNLKSHSYIFYPYNLARVKSRVGYFPVPTVPRKKGISKYNLLSKFELLVKVCASILFGYGSNLRYKVKKVF